jgi:myo-inositol-1-phosphate synthase
MLVEDFTVQSQNVTYTDDHITSRYIYDSTKLDRSSCGDWIVQPTKTQYEFRVNRRVPKLGYAFSGHSADMCRHIFNVNLFCRVMLVGWGGNNGTTVTAGILANKQ